MTYSVSKSAHKSIDSEVEVKCDIDYRLMSLLLGHLGSHKSDPMIE